MKATVYTEYGSPDVLKLKEVATPTLGDNDVLIQIHAAAVNAGDRILLRGDPFMIRLTAGLRKPKHQILGADVAGRVAAVGRNVTQFQVGDDGVRGSLRQRVWRICRVCRGSSACSRAETGQDDVRGSGSGAFGGASPRCRACAIRRRSSLARRC